MNDTGNIRKLTCAGSLHKPAVPDVWHNHTQSDRMKIYEEVTMGERTFWENATIRVMKAMIGSGELTFTPDQRMVLRSARVSENNQSSFYIEISEDLHS